jgi:hypothetical protein
MTEASTPNGAATSENPNGLSEDSSAPLVEIEMMRQELAVIQFLERLDHLYRDLLDSRDRELTVKDCIYQDLLTGRDREIEVKDRLITELERRAQQAEEHTKLLQEYIANLSAGSTYQQPAEDTQDESPAQNGRQWWHLWR